MKTFFTIVLVIYIVAIEANITKDKLADVNSSEDDLIDDMNINGNESLFSAVVFMKKNKVNEEITLDSDEDKKPDSAPLVVEDRIEQNRATNSFSDEEDNKTYENDTDNEELDGHLRKRPWRGCLKKGSKVCRKACKTAVKDACAYHDCKKRIKTALKKECKRSCKRYFLDD